MIGTRRVALILRSKPVVIGESLDINRFANGSKLTSVAGVITISADGDGEKYTHVVGVGEKFINVAGDGVSSTSAGGGGEKYTFADGDGEKYTSVAGDRPMFAGGIIVVTSSGANGATLAGGITGTSAGGNKYMSMSVGGKSVTSAGGN